MNIKLPGWLEAAILTFAAYLKGLVDQRQADRAAQDRATTSTIKTVEDAARQVGQMSDDDVQAELDRWRRS